MGKVLGKNNIPLTHVSAMANQQKVNSSKVYKRTKEGKAI